MNAVSEKLLEKPKNIDQEFDKWLEEISPNLYLFNRKEILVDILRVCDPSINMLLSFFDYHIGNQHSRKKLSSQFYGKNTKYKKLVGNAVLIENHKLFRRSMPLQALVFHEPATTELDSTQGATMFGAVRA